MSAKLPHNEFAPVAIIGAGHIAQQHAGALVQTIGPENVSICDLSASVAEAVADRFQLRAHYDNFEKQLEMEQPKVVHITTPAPSHYFIAKKCLEAGAHVFLEKPATEKLSQLEELLALAESKNLFLVEDQNYPFNLEVQRMINQARAGEFGDVLHVDAVLTLNLLGEGSRYIDTNNPHPSAHEPGGAISDFLTHLCSLVYPFVGAHKEIKTIWRKDTDAPLPFDEFRGLLNCERGTGALTMSCRGQPDGFWVKIYGTKGQAQASLWEPQTSRMHALSGPLAPVINAMNGGINQFIDGPRTLLRKLSGGPGSYGGLWNLIEQTYGALNAHNPLPLDHHWVRSVNLMVHDILSEVSDK